MVQARWLRVQLTFMFVWTLLVSVSVAQEPEREYLELVDPYVKYGVVLLSPKTQDYSRPVSGLLVGDQGYILAPDTIPGHEGGNIDTHLEFQVEHPTGVSAIAHLKTCQSGACLLWVDKDAFKNVYPNLYSNPGPGKILFDCRDIEFGPVTVVGELSYGPSPLSVVIPDIIIAGRNSTRDYLLSYALGGFLAGSVVVGTEGTALGIVLKDGGELKYGGVPTPYTKFISSSSITDILNQAGTHCETENDRSKILIALGDNKKDRGDLQAAMLEYKKAAAAAINDKWEPLYRISQVEYDEGNHCNESARDAYAAYTLKNNDLALLISVADSQKQCSNLQDALKTYSEIIDGFEHKNPSDPARQDQTLVSAYREAYFERGRVRLLIQTTPYKKSNKIALQQELVAAEADLQQFLDKDGTPKHFALYHIACVKAMLGDKEAAQKYLDAATAALDALRTSSSEQDPKHPVSDQRQFLYDALTNVSNPNSTLVLCPSLQGSSLYRVGKVAAFE